MHEGDVHLSGEDTYLVVEKLMLESLACERQRYESMLSASGRMVAGLSLVSVALVTAMPVLFERFECHVATLGVEFAFIFLLLAASLLFAILASYRRSYKTLHDPNTIYSEAKKRKVLLGNLEDARLWMSEYLGDAFSGLKGLNDWMGRWLRVSNLLLMIDLGTILLFGIVDAVVFLSPGC